MRILIPHTYPCRAAGIATVVGSDGALHELCTYGGPEADVAWDAAREPIDALERRLSEWTPDAFVFGVVEYFSAPFGIEDAPWLTAALVGDWNLGGQAAQLVAGSADVVLADQPGCERLRALGLPVVLHVPFWSFDPAVHRPVPGAERDIDIAMVGNFNHAVQSDRARWLARVAALSARWRVCVTTNVHGEDYARLMSRSRIVFNRSIRGEMNMRAFEAPACGALLFLERGNREVGAYYADGLECVLYGDDDLEPLLERYLADEDARARVARAGRARCLAFGPEHHLARLADVLAASRASRGRRAGVPPRERLHRHLRHALLVDWDPATTWRRAEAAAGLPGGLRLQAAMLAELSRRLPDGERRIGLLREALQLGARGLEAAPGDAAGLLNLARMHRAAGDSGGATAAARRALAALDDPLPDPDGLDGPYFPREFDVFGVEVEHVWASARRGSPEWTEGMRRALTWRACDLLCDAALESGGHQEALAFAERGLDALPHAAATRRKAALALLALGRGEEAGAMLRRAVEVAPLDPQLWIDLCELLRALGREEDCLRDAARFLAIVDGCPPYAGWRARLEPFARPAVPPLGGGRLRLLACPDWSRPAEWQEPLRACALALDAGDPVTVVLHVDPRIEPDAGPIARRVASFLDDDLALPEGRQLDVVLLHRPIEPERACPVWREGDMLLTSGEAGPALAAACPLPMLPCAWVAHARDVLRARSA